MALPASDNYNRANGGLGANWTTPAGANAPTISGNQVVGTGGDCFAYWSADAFTDDQYAEYTLPDVTHPDSGICARLQEDGSGGKGYLYSPSSGGVWKLSGGFGGASLLATISTSPANGDALRIEVTGTSTVTIRIFKNAVQFGTDVTDASSPITGGAGGIFVFGTTDPIDNFGAGNLGAAAFVRPTLVAVRQAVMRAAFR